MFPSGKGATDSCTVGGSDVVNIDVVDAEMNESGDMVEGKQETKIATNGSNNGDNANTEEIKQDESESGKVPRRSDEKSDSTSIRTEHSSLPLHRCMRIVPQHQQLVASSRHVEFLRRHIDARPRGRNRGQAAEGRVYAMLIQATYGCSYTKMELAGTWITASSPPTMSPSWRMSTSSLERRL
jgi:hypothetical protein